MKAYTATELAKRKQQTDEIARIESLPEVEKWRAIKRLLFEVNPHLREIDRGHCEALRDERVLNARKTGATDKGTRRRIVSLPVYLQSALQACDPNFLRADLSKDEILVKKLYRKVWRVFPEYRCCDVL